MSAQWSDAEAAHLLPNRRVKHRLIVLGCLAALALIGSAAWYEKLFFVASMALLLGTEDWFRSNLKLLEKETGLPVERR